MTAEMSFCLLGPLAVRCGEVELPIPPGKQRALLAVLLLNARRVVSVDEITEALWGPGPPASARMGVQNYVMRLRKALAAAGQARVRTQPGGYLINVGSGELDVSRFEALSRAARAAAREGSWETTAERAVAALALWRGEPLADVGSEVLVARELPRLAELRLQVLEARIGADVHLGRQAEVIAELQGLAGVHPLREHLHALLMLALYREGRQAEALAAYQHARRVLAEELGAEPGTELQNLHQRILTSDPDLAVPEPGRPAGGPPPVLPRQVPAPVAHFTGRPRELAALTRLLDPGGAGTPGAVVISAIGGTAGVGKTALAVHWAHQIAERFPDGQLYVNLRGYDPGQPMAAADALLGFLRALGVPGQDIPAGADERAAQYRSLLAGRRMLVLLDNVGDAEQVRPLLPGAPGCVALLTSRDALTGLVARDGARRLDLDVLPQEDAVGLLRVLIDGRVDADPVSAAAFAAQCCRLPLALRVAAERAAARPDLPLSDLVRELADQQRRLDLLDAGGDTRTAVRGVFSWSYPHLDTATARTFRLAGLHPGPDFGSYEAAVLTGTTVEDAGHMLDMLARAHLIHPTSGPGRYGLHDLLRAYAREVAAEQDSEEERRAALTRLLDYYVHTAAIAMVILFPSEQGDRPPVPPPVTPALPMDGRAAPRDWLDAQRANLVAVVAHAADNDWPGHAIHLAATLYRYLDIGGHYPEAAVVHSCARDAAGQAGDQAAEATALVNLGVADFRQGCYQQASDHLQQSMVRYRELGDQTGEARALVNMGLVDQWQGRCEQAADHLQRALSLWHASGNLPGQAYALGNLGLVSMRLGRWQQGADQLEQSVALFRKTGDRVGEGYALSNLGEADLRLGRYERGKDHIRQARDLYRETGNRSGEAHALTCLGDFDLRQGHHQQAGDNHQQAMVLFRETGDRAGEAEALNGLGEVSLAAGSSAHARAQHTAALRLASIIGEQTQQARAHDGLARSYRAAGEAAQAHAHWQEALIGYTDLGSPEAEQVRAQLAAAGHNGRRGP